MLNCVIWGAEIKSLLCLGQEDMIWGGIADDGQGVG